MNSRTGILEAGILEDKLSGKTGLVEKMETEKEKKKRRMREEIIQKLTRYLTMLASICIFRGL